METSTGPPPPFELEGPECEWKERLPRSERVGRTFAAFANGVGGWLWVGVRDDGRVIGVGRPDEVERELERIASDLVVPPLEVTIGRHVHAGRVLLVARVERAETRPVLAPGRDGSPQAFHRDGASTRIAPRALVKSWERASPARSLDTKARRILREIAERSHHDGTGPNLVDVARFGRIGKRAARRLVVDLVQQGLVTERDGGRFGLTPEGHRRVRRR
ncbi:MAG: ATP-binding protein [Planctomycetota bacterium]|nr:ATP-binding protein [Planctomycetota bacterium]